MMGIEELVQQYTLRGKTHELHLGIRCFDKYLFNIL